MTTPIDQPFVFVPNYGPWMTSVIEHGFHRTWINGMTPERLAQYKAHRKQYYEDNKAKIREQCKQRQQIKHTCDVCGGRYSCNHKLRHCQSQKHQRAISTTN